MQTEKLEILSVEELSKYISRTPSAIRNLVMRRKVPYRRLSGRLAFLKNEIDAWINNSPGLRVDEILKKH